MTRVRLAAVGVGDVAQRDYLPELHRLDSRVELAVVCSRTGARADEVALQFGARALSWKAFFRVSEAMLLVLAGSLLMNGLDRLISLDVLSPLSQPLWDTSWLLDDARGVGGLLATLTGYRARPELLPVIVFGGYWFVVSLLGSWLPRRAAAVS